MECIALINSTPSPCQHSAINDNNLPINTEIISEMIRPDLFPGLQFGERELGLGQVLMFTTRLGQLCSLEQICSLMMFSAIGSMFMFFRATSRNNKTSQTTPGTLTGGFCLSNARCPLYNVFCPLSLQVSTLPIPRT